MARAEVLAILRRAGLSGVADEVEPELSDPVEDDDLERIAERYGITRSWLIDRMGGSP